MAQIAPNITSAVTADGGAQFATTSGQPVNQSSGAEPIQSQSSSAYPSASPVAYTAPHLYSSNVLPYGTSSLSGANILPASSVLYPPVQSQTPNQPPNPSQSQSEPGTPASHTAKRKQPDDIGGPSTPAQAGPSRKRRVAVNITEGDRDDLDLGPHGGPKHWTDNEKSSLFSWLLVHDKHWDMFKTKMNTVFRDASVQIFGGRKSFTALKSCYHRNVETFKQIFAFEVFLARALKEKTVPDEMSALATHSDPSIARQAYLEQRLEDARTAGVPVGNLNVKVIDHWHQNGWYGMFKTRFREDPRTGLPVPFYGPTSMSFPNGPSAPQTNYGSPEIDPQLTNGGEQEDDEKDDESDESEQEVISHVHNAISGPMAKEPSSRPPQGATEGEPSLPRSHSRARQSSQLGTPARKAPVQSPHQAPSMLFSNQTQLQTVQALDRLTAATQTLVERCTDLTQMLRTEAEERRARSAAMGEKKERTEDGLNRKEKAALATEMLANADVGDEVRNAAADYLKRLFMSA